MEGTQRRNEGVLHCWLGQCHRVGSDDSDWADEFWGYARVEKEAVPLVYVTHAVIQNISEILLNALHARFYA
jgi:hypothetical protein